MLGPIWQTGRKFRQEIREKQIHLFKNKIRKKIFQSSTSSQCQLCRQTTLSLSTSQLSLKDENLFLFSLLQNEEKYCPLHQITVVNKARESVIDFPIFFKKFCEAHQWQDFSPSALRRILKLIFELLVDKNLEQLVVEGILHSRICEAIISGIVTAIQIQDEMEVRILQEIVKQIQLMLITQYPIILLLYPYQNTLQNLLNLNQSYVTVAVLNSLASLLQLKKYLYESSYVKNKIKTIVKDYIISKNAIFLSSEEVLQTMINLLYLLLNQGDTDLNIQNEAQEIFSWAALSLKEKHSSIIQQFVVWLLNQSFVKKQIAIKVLEDQLEGTQILNALKGSSMDVQI